MTLLKIENLNVKIDKKDVLNGINLEVSPEEIHVIMGPNGVGKSTLGHVLMGSQQYKVTSGNIFFNKENINNDDTTTRAKKGIFLAFQYPVSIPGLKLSEYLRNLYCQRFQTQISVSEFRKILKEKLELLKIDRSTLSRYLNDGFSGGETKRFEILQLMLLEPKVAILDEIDSGVDVDGQKILAQCIEYMVKNYQTSFIIVTHYRRLIQFLNSNRIHIMLDGKIQQSGDFSLVDNLEKFGFRPEL